MNNEQIEHYYIGLADFFFVFFSGKSVKICSRSVSIFRGLTCSFFSSSVHFHKRKANSTIQKQKCKGHEKRDRHLISKMEINYQISQRNKSFAYSSSFLTLG